MKIVYNIMLIPIAHVDPIRGAAYVLGINIIFMNSSSDVRRILKMGNWSVSYGEE